MEKFSNFFYRLIQVFILIAVGAILISVFINLPHDDRGVFSFELSQMMFLTLFLGIMILFLPIKKEWKVGLILLLSALLRLWYAFRVPTGISSDFATMYDAAKKLLSGDATPYQGLGYMARFPHFAPTSLYMALMIILFPTHHLLGMRVVSFILSVVSVYLIYRLSFYFVKSEKARLVTLILAGVYPALLAYSSTYVTENLAMPLFLLAVILLLDKREKTGAKAILWGTLTGSVLLFAHLFRGVGTFFLIAFLLYTFLYTSKGKFYRMGSMMLSYFLSLLLISTILTSAGIMDRPLWEGAEPKTATAALKGSNFSSGGMWNAEDALFVEEHLGDPDLSKMCFEIIGERFTSVPPFELLGFFGNKFISQWNQGDAGGAFWSFSGTSSEAPYPRALPNQLFYAGVLVLSLISLLSKKKNGANMVFWSLLCAFGTLFAVIETQGRYSYIIVWAFILMAGAALERKEVAE